MSENINITLQQIVKRKATEYSLKKTSRNQMGSVIPIFSEEWHLFGWLNHQLVPTLEIQCSISMDGDFVRTVWFPHPVLITPEAKTDFILFANEANIELHSGGRFWCNEDMDFAYEIVLSVEIIEKCEEETARLLFDIPLAHFRDLHIPFMMLASNVWQADTAISYLKELRENGCVDNQKYNLW